MIDFDLVWNVYNDDFTIKACGRNACKNLISHLSSLYPAVNFGNINTGYLYTPNIVTVINRELSTKCD